MKIIIIGAGPNGIAAYLELINNYPNAEILILDRGQGLMSLRQMPDVVWHSEMNNLVINNSGCDENINLFYRPKTSELISYFEEVIERNRIFITRNTEVLRISRSGDQVELQVKTADSKSIINANFVLVSTGFYGNKRMLDVICSNISYDYEIDWVSKHLLLIGSGNSAVDFIIQMLPQNRVTWVIRGSTFSHIFSNTKDKFESVLLRFSGNLELIFNDFILEEISIGKVKLNSGRIITDVDYIIPLLGFTSRAEFLLNSNISFTGEAVKMDDFYESSLKNVFMIGALSTRVINGVLQRAFISNGNKDILKKVISKINIRIGKITLNNKFFVDNPYVQEVLVVCHPDDELLWGWRLLRDRHDLHVFCVTNGNSKRRISRFIEVMDLYGISYSLMNFKDNGSYGLSLEDIEDISTKLFDILNSPRIKKVYTHNELGEYGHPAHCGLNYIISNIIIDRSKLFVFTIRTKNFELDALTKKALYIYYSRFSFSDFFSRLLKNKRRFYRVLIGVDDFKSYVNFLIHGRDDDGQALMLGHIESMKRTEFVGIDHFVVEDDLCSDIHNSYLTVPKSALDVLSLNSAFYDLYQDRKYLVTKILPNINGTVLSVGCHSYNKFDYLFLENKQMYFTIDINPSYKVFGSPSNHFVGDFLNFEFNRKFDNIILFGVLGIPNVGFNDNYTMYNFEDSALERAVSLLNPKGTLIIGPDVSLNKVQSRSENINFWEYKLLGDKFLSNLELIEKEYFTNNLIFVFRKK